MARSESSGAVEDRSALSRDDRWKALLSEEFDILILGGGINGAGIARDAALRGLKVALVDRGDFASGTSSRSSKLVHGGLRYLETYQFHLVRESTAERAVQMRLAPHLVRPLPFLFPIYRHHPHGIFFIDLGLWLYDTLALYRVPKLHRAFDASGTLGRQGALRSDGLKGALWYFDCATDDGRLVLENIQDAARLGAVVLNYVEAVDLIRGQGGVRGAVVRDALSQETAEVRAKMVVSTLGPFTDEFLSGASQGHERLVRVSRGSHLVFDAARLKLPEAVVMLNVEDHRPVFCIPWGDRIYVGTTDVDHEGPLDEVACSQQEADYLFDVLGSYFPDLGLGPADVLGVWSGLRPLADEPGVAEASQVSREHRIVEVEKGLVVLVGGKLTTYRLMSAEVLDLVCRLEGFAGAGSAGTHRRVLPGAVGLEEMGGLDGLVGRLESMGAAPESARALAESYGTAAVEMIEGGSEPIVEGRPEVMAQVDWAVRYEFAVRLQDVMLRRTGLGLRDARLSLQVVGRIAARMAALLGWDADKTEDEKQAYDAYVKRQMAFAWSGGAADSM